MGATAFTAPTLTPVQEANLETYKQVYETLDTRLADLEANQKRGKLHPSTYKAAKTVVQKLMENVSEKANELTGCPLGIWLE